MCLMSEVWQIGEELQCVAWHPISPQHRPAARSTVQPTKSRGRARKPERKSWTGTETRGRKNGGRGLLSWREPRGITVRRVRLWCPAHTHVNTRNLISKGKRVHKPWTHCATNAPPSSLQELISQWCVPFDHKHKRKRPWVGKSA